MGVLFIALFWGAVWWSLLLPFPIQGKTQLISIASGDNYTRLIQRWSEQNKIHFPVLLKLYQKLLLRESLKAGVYQINQGMSVAEVLSMLSNADNAQMNRLLVIEGSTFAPVKSTVIA